MKFLTTHKQSILKILGIVIITLTILSVYQSHITWMWEGCIGLGVGILLFWVPQRVAGIVLKILNLVTKVLLGNRPN
jgi:O-antigen ligase